MNGVPEWIQGVFEELSYGGELRGNSAEKVWDALVACGTALRRLRDEQQGPPLLRRELEWSEAMREADEALRVYEGGPSE